jgi:hypothetical protein
MVPWLRIYGGAVGRRGTQIDTCKSSGQITSRRVADDVVSKRVFEKREVGELHDVIPTYTFNNL